MTFKTYFCLSREYIEGESLTYVCLDSTLGVSSGPSAKIQYKCIHDIPYSLGYYDVPEDEKLWPTCVRKTTTVAPGKEIIHECNDFEIEPLELSYLNRNLR